MRDQEHKIEIAEASHKEAQDELSKIGEMIDKAADGTRDINIKLEEIRNSASGFEEKLSDIDSQIKVAENSILHNNETIERINVTRLRRTRRSKILTPPFPLHGNAYKRQRSK